MHLLLITALELVVGFDTQAGADIPLADVGSPTGASTIPFTLRTTAN